MLLPPPPRSTLFPYTTLFRSNKGARRHPRGGLAGDGTSLTTRAGEPITTAPAGDRKSTRLNSSHVAISYAVFCLKKKTNKKKRTISDSEFYNEHRID